MNPFAKKWSICGLLVALALSACATVPAGPDPVVQVGSTNFTAIRDAIQSRCLDLNRQMAAPEELQILRNDLVTAYMLAADIEYGRYETRLLENVRTNNFAGSLSVITLSAVAGVIGDRELVRGLTTATGIIAGGQKAYTTDQLLNETVSVLQQQMRASRAAQRAMILSKLNQPYATWSFCLAFQDAQAYERAGTLNAALAEIAASASQARRENEAIADAVTPMLAYERGGLATALRAYVFPVDRTLWPARRTIAVGLVESRNIPPLNGTPLYRLSRILNGSGTELEAARRALAEGLLDDGTVDEGTKTLLREALAQ